MISLTQTQNIGHRTLFVAGRMNFVITEFTGLALSDEGGTSYNIKDYSISFFFLFSFT